MTRKVILNILLIGIFSCGVVAQPPSGEFGPRPMRTSTRPPMDNERKLRELSPEEIPPNLNFYAMNPLYRNDVTHRMMGYAHYPMTSYYLGTK